MKKVTITLRRSLIGRPEKQRRIVRALGLKKINQSVSREDTPVIRGMVRKTSHLVELAEE